VQFLIVPAGAEPAARCLLTFLADAAPLSGQPFPVASVAFTSDALSTVSTTGPGLFRSQAGRVSINAMLRLRILLQLSGAAWCRSVI
jgi:hypothetical protein